LRKQKDALYWLIFLFSFPLIFNYVYVYFFSSNIVIFVLSIILAFAIFFLWGMIGDFFRSPTKKLEWEDSESVEDTTEGKPSAEKYSVEEKTAMKEKGIFSRIFSKEDECEKCGTELVYKEGAGSYYCPECQEYKWK